MTAGSGSLVYTNAKPVRTARAAARPMAPANETKVFLIVCLLHLPLGVLLYNVGSLAILHPLAVMAVGTYWALNRRYPLERTAMAAGYLIGCEILWRMAQIPVFWEIGKYGTAALMVAALISRRRFYAPLLPLFYFASLLPACILTIAEFDLEDSRGILSSNMSGPLLLLVSCWFFSHIHISTAGVYRLLYSVFLPILSVGCVTLFYTVTLEDIQFGGESNFATSGGFGPNQVSAILGLGVFLTGACIVLFQNRGWKFKAALGLATLFLAAQSLLTFSRGGMYNAVGGLLILVVLHFRSVIDGLKRVIPLAVLFVLFMWLVFPVLDNFTGGKLEERFEDTGTTHRTELLEGDLEVFVKNPVLGVGVGSAREHRQQEIGISGISHTEFTRLLSEHGSFGLIALFLLCGMAGINIKRQKTILGRALIAGACAWSVLFMFNAAMRLGAPSFLWGMGFMSIGAAATIRPRLKRKAFATTRHAGETAIS